MPAFKPQQAAIFQMQLNCNTYNEITPYKFIASAAYVFKEVENVKLQKGFISADIEYVNHRGSRFMQQTGDDGGRPGC